MKICGSAKCQKCVRTFKYETYTNKLKYLNLIKKTLGWKEFDATKFQINKLFYNFDKRQKWDMDA